MSRLLAIVPAFNEAEAISATIADLREHAPAFDVLVVDDGSHDATAAAARAAGAAVVSHAFNLGIGAAVQSGYQFARERDYDVAVQFDGDGQHDARSLALLLDTLRTRAHCNMVVGSRFLEPAGNAGEFRSTGARRLGIRIFSMILGRVVRRPVTDPTSGLRMCDRLGIELFARDYPHDYPEVEAVLLLHAHRLTATEVGVVMRARKTGVSSINASHSVLYMAKVLLAIFVGLLRRRPPLTPLARPDAPQEALG